MWVDNDVPNWFLTSKNFYRSPFSKWPPQYRTNSTLSDFNDISYWTWKPVEFFQCRESIQDVEIEQCWICAVLWWPFLKWLPVEIFRCHESFRDIIIYPHMHNTTKIQHCLISKVAFNLFFKPVVCGRFGRLHNR
jgi:hypothetical protein